MKARQVLLQVLISLTTGVAAILIVDAVRTRAAGSGLLQRGDVPGQDQV